MAEYIERATLMGALTSIEMQQAIKKMDGADAYNKMVNLVNSVPAADVVEVVRCKGCAFWDGDGRCDPRRNGLTVEYTDPYDYCSYGKRKDEKGDDE